MDFTVDPTVRNISNSEVTTFLSCKRQYDYSYLMELQPKETADPLARGSIFHEAMYFYWRARMEGHNHELSMTMAEDAFINPCEPTNINVIMQAQMLWVRYMNAHAGFPDMKPLGAEVQHTVPLTSTINMAIKYDFYFEDIPTGKRYILDYKLAYEFWKQEDHDLNGQMPKYIAALQANGYQVDGGYLEEIRTRELGKDKQRDPANLFRRTRYAPSSLKKKSVLQQHISAALLVERHRNLPPEERKIESIPVLNKHGACKFCNFQDLCISELEGKTDLSVDIRVGYTQNTYLEQYNERINF